MQAGQEWGTHCLCVLLYLLHKRFMTSFFGTQLWSPENLKKQSKASLFISRLVMYYALCVFTLLMFHCELLFFFWVRLSPSAFCCLNLSYQFHILFLEETIDKKCFQHWHSTLVYCHVGAGGANTADLYIRILVKQQISCGVPLIRVCVLPGHVWSLALLMFASGSERRPKTELC